MTELVERLDPHLRLAFALEEGSSAVVAAHSSSASGIMEASLRGVGPRVLCVVNGAFSRRYAQMAESLGKEVVTVDVPWGLGVDPDALRETLRERGPFDAVTFAANETSTGVRTPIESVAAVLREFPEVLLLVDLVSHLAGADVGFDANGLDFGFAGVQKALACPPGVTVFCCSERYLERARRAERRGWSLDPVRIVEGHVARKTPATPTTPVYYALAKQLEDISAGTTLPEGERTKRGLEAWRARYAKHERMRERVREWIGGLGLEFFSGAGFESATVSCVRAGGVDVGRLVKGLAERGFEISNGYGDLKGQTFRIGHLGDHTEEGLEALLGAAGEVLRGAGG
jgi:aspartate aminotransferase-like enzyme